MKKSFVNTMNLACSKSVGLKILQEGAAAKESKPTKTGRDRGGLQIRFSNRLSSSICGNPLGFMYRHIQVSMSTEATAAVDLSGARFLAARAPIGKDDTWKPSSDRLSSVFSFVTLTRHGTTAGTRPPLRRPRGRACRSCGQDVWD